MKKDSIIYVVKVDAGCIGTDMTTLVLSNEDNISDIASEIAWENWSSYDNINKDVLSVEDIMNQEGVDEQEAESIRTEEIYSSMSIEFEPLMKENADGYDWHNFNEDDLKAYLRDYKINKIIN